MQVSIKATTRTNPIERLKIKKHSIFWEGTVLEGGWFYYTQKTSSGNNMHVDQAKQFVIGDKDASIMIALEMLKLFENRGLSPQERAQLVEEFKKNI